MSKSTIIFISIILIPLAFIGGLKCQQTLSKFDEIGKPLFNSVVFLSQDQKDTCYLVSKTWGLTGDHQVTVLTKRRPSGINWTPDPKADYIWNASFSTVFYQQVGNTIKIFSTNQPNSPVQFNSRLNINLVTITPNKFDRLQILTDTGLKKFDYMPTHNIEF